MASLLILTGSRKGTRLPLTGERVVLGRDAACDVVINESMLSRPQARADNVSRRHATLSRADGGYSIEDGDGRGNRSRNGVRVNDREVPFPGKVRLRHDDRIRICDFSCAFHEDEDDDSTFTVEATLDHESSARSLQAQPAERLRVLLELSNSLGRTLDVDSLLPAILDHLFRLFRQAQRGFVVLRDEATGATDLRAFRSRDPDDADGRFSASVVGHCLGRVEAVLGNDLPRQFPQSESVVALPVRSLVCAPLCPRRGEAAGAVLLDGDPGARRFTQDDLALLVGVASQASVALSNAQFHLEALGHQRRRRELELAREVHRALLPQGLPDLPGYEFYAHSEPAHEVGGDYYDFVPLPGGRLAVLLGDVAGKGVAAALVMARFGVEARVCLERESDLAAAVTRLNAVIHRADLAGRFVTLIAAVIDPLRHTATLVNAGHPSPLLVRRQAGGVEEATPRAAAGYPIGIFPAFEYRSCQVHLGPGDILHLFSDGVSEATDSQGKQFRTSGARAVLHGPPATPREQGSRLLQAVREHASGCSQHDDLTLMAFGRVGP